MKSAMVSIGNFLFKWRNKLFPVIILLLFLSAVPPHEIAGKRSLEITQDCIAILLVFSGLAMRAVVIGYAYIKRGGMAKKVYAADLVTGGMFGVCRNPLYVGNVLIYSGIFIMHGAPVVVIVGIGLYLFIYQCIIYAEEAYLEDKFGDAYRAYCKDVPRWIPRFSKLAESSEGMDFNLQRVLVKDYSTIANAVAALALIECYEYLALNDWPATHSTIYALLGFVAIVGLWVGGVRYYKKRIM
jgi:protein-S-isoprenylcysteine O-methyltransferase Ste14